MGQESGGNKEKIRIKKNNPKQNKKKISKTEEILDSFKYLYTNADTLSNKLDELKAIVADTKPNIIAITEVKPKFNRYKVLPSELQLDDYNMYTNNWDEKGTRGMACYIDKRIEAKPLSLGTNYSECIWMDLALNDKDHMLFGCIYRSPSNSDVTNENLF
jgi:exonuclease III